MKVVYFTHSLRSCWNHGNAHFLRGILRELRARGHAAQAFEPEGAWSLDNLLGDHGPAGLDAYAQGYPDLDQTVYGPGLDLDRALDGADLVIVHEWNDHALVARIGAHRRRGGHYTLLFHDTHHRAVSEPDAMRAYDLDGYDGVLAFGETLAAVYRGWGWGDRVWVWHEAADIRLFHPPRAAPHAGDLCADHSLRQSGAERSSEPGTHDGVSQVVGSGFHAAHGPGMTAVESCESLQDEDVAPGTGRRGLVWIGNWGDDERSDELEAHLFRPAATLGLPLDVWGVRYPETALAALARHGASYRGWLPNARAPSVFARHLATIHVPRRFYVERLPGIPTIRVFEALACGIPLVSAPWQDSEGLFRVGTDFLMADDPAAMARHLRAVRDDADLRAALVRHGLETIRARHTCAHRVDELLAVVGRIGAAQRIPESVA